MKYLTTCDIYLLHEQNLILERGFEVYEEGYRSSSNRGHDRSYTGKRGFISAVCWAYNRVHKEDLIQVEDQDGDVFDVEPDKINPIEV